MKQKPTKKCENGVQLRPASIEEAGLFYSELDQKQDEALGTVGHIRMDFGSGGKEFWHTWWPHNEDRFNTLEFKEELQAIVDTLRANGPLKDLASMSNYCHKNGGTITEDSRSFGYVAETDHYRYDFAFEAISWALGENASPLLGYLEPEGAHLVFRFLPGGDPGQWRFSEELTTAAAALGGQIACKDLDDAVGICMTLPLGGESCG